jgi:uncharacterized membrane protein YeaQ/YmgE (transglycosylase-associated protein family)
MTILGWAVFGLAAGAFASWFVPAKRIGGLIGDIAIGVAGALAGGWLYQSVHANVTPFNPSSMLCALIGAAAVLWLLRAVNARRSAA